MLRNGDFWGAAQIYERLATEAYQRERTRAGVQMDLEAGRAYAQAEEYDEAGAHALHALRAQLSVGLPPRPVMPLVNRLYELMGDTEEARRFREQVRDLLEQAGISTEQEVHAETTSSPAPAAVAEREPARGKLPAQCPACYAPLYSAEVEWVESDRAQCPYCGRIVLAG